MAGGPKKSSGGGDCSLKKIGEQGVLGRYTVRYLEETGSTNEDALGQDRDHLLIVADYQRAGRGRLGRQWRSPRGTGLYCSFRRSMALPVDQLARVTLAAGVAVSYAVQQISGRKTMIKWPNDLLQHGKKVAGILTEAAPQTGGGGAIPVVIGIGVNVNTPPEAFADGLEEKAGSLALEGGTTYSRGSLLVAIADHLETNLSRLEEGRFSAIMAQWQSRDATLGRWLRWLTPAGETIVGKSLGPDDTGRLQIQTADGRCHQVLSGDLTLLAGPSMSA